MYSSGSREFPHADEDLEEYNNELPAAGLEEPLEAIRKLGAQQPDVSSAIMTFEVSKSFYVPSRDHPCHGPVRGLLPLHATGRTGSGVSCPMESLQVSSMSSQTVRMAISHIVMTLSKLSVVTKGMISEIEARELFTMFGLSFSL